MKKILGAKEAPKRHSCVLEISSKGIKMIDKSKMNVSFQIFLTIDEVVARIDGLEQVPTQFPFVQLERPL